MLGPIAFVLMVAFGAIAWDAYRKFKQARPKFRRDLTYLDRRELKKLIRDAKRDLR